MTTALALVAALAACVGVALQMAEQHRARIKDEKRWWTIHLSLLKCEFCQSVEKEKKRRMKTVLIICTGCGKRKIVPRPKL